MGRLLGLGAAIGGGYSVWHYCFAPLPDPPLRSGAAQEIARFMEANKKYWDTDASTFSETPAQLARMVEYPRPTDGPCFCVTRNVRRYNGVPMLRVTTFLPNVSVDEMVPRMLEKEPRKRWDQNYKFFEEFAELPVPKEVADMRHGFVATARHWCGHVLASATLEKVGVLPRAFLYERIIARRDDGAVCATFRGLNDDEKDVITATTVRHSEFARETLPLVQDPNLPEAKSFAGLLRDRFFAGPAADSQEAIMYWQELLLIPVRRKDIKIQAFEAKKDVGTRDEFPAPTGVASVLFAAAYEFFDEGNPFTSGADRLMYHPAAAAYGERRRRRPRAPRTRRRQPATWKRSGR
jgi:hypothetical protein